jgi:YggT family protein
LPGVAVAMDVVLVPLIEVLIYALELYKWVLIISAVLSWLIAFNVVNTRNRFVYSIADMMYRITEPVLRPIRNLMPNLGGVDLSPIVLILIIWLIQKILANLAFRI